MYPLVHMPDLTDHAEHKLQSVDAELWPSIKDDIVSERAQLFQCPDDTYVVLRIENNELIVVACVGSNGIALMQRIIEIAREHGLSFVRFHTARHGLSRLVRRFNPVEIERMYRINVE